MVVDDRDDAVFTSLGNSTGFRRVINRIDEVSDNTTEKGDLFEKVVKAFIEQDKARSERFSHVWRWYDWPVRRLKCPPRLRRAGGAAVKNRLGNREGAGGSGRCSRVL